MSRPLVKKIQNRRRSVNKEFRNYEFTFVRALRRLPSFILPPTIMKWIMAISLAELDTICSIIANPKYFFSVPKSLIINSTI